MIDIQKKLYRDKNDEVAQMDRESLEKNKEGQRYKYQRTALSGSTWKYLQLAYFCGIQNLEPIYNIAIAFLVGCYHHTWYEVTQSALDFKEEVTSPDEYALYQGNPENTLSPVTLNINDRYWYLNENSDFFKDKDKFNPSLTRFIKKVLRQKIFKNREKGVVVDQHPEKNYLHFYTKFIYPVSLTANNTSCNCDEIIARSNNINDRKKIDYQQELQKEVASNIRRSQRNRRQKRYDDYYYYDNYGGKTKKIKVKNSNKYSKKIHVIKKKKNKKRKNKKTIKKSQK
jgi:hypothetical protein